MTWCFVHTCPQMEVLCVGFNETQSSHVGFWLSESEIQLDISDKHLGNPDFPVHMECSMNFSKQSCIVGNVGTSRWKETKKSQVMKQNLTYLLSVLICRIFMVEFLPWTAQYSLILSTGRKNDHHLENMTISIFLYHLCCWAEAWTRAAHGCKINIKSLFHT